MIFIRKIYWLLSMQLGIDLRRMFRSIRGIPKYIRDLIIFRQKYNGKLDFLPCLYDWYEEGGSTKDEYFLQDLHVARKIHLANPEKHVDIGSRIDGFVAHVASFRSIEVFDIRPITTQIPGVIFKQADLMETNTSIHGYCDSLSCLHALEHFGLGRYDDPIDPNGFLHGLENMANILKTGGIFYLSVPIGNERVEFNAQRIFDPIFLIKIAKSNKLSLNEFAWIDTTRLLKESRKPDEDVYKLASSHYSLGIFTFIKE